MPNTSPPSVCPPPATNATGKSLAAPAPGGQGVGTFYRRLRLARASAFTALMWSFSSFCSRFRVRLWWITIAVQIAPNTTTAATAAQTLQITSGGITFIESSLLGVVLLFVGCQVLALALFWLIIVPFHDWLVVWIVERLS